MVLDIARSRDGSGTIIGEVAYVRLQCRDSSNATKLTFAYWIVIRLEEPIESLSPLCDMSASGSFASFWPPADYFRSSPANGHRPVRYVSEVPEADSLVQFDHLVRAEEK